MVQLFAFLIILIYCEFVGTMIFFIVDAVPLMNFAANNLVSEPLFRKSILIKLLPSCSIISPCIWFPAVTWLSNFASISKSVLFMFCIILGAILPELQTSWLVPDGTVIN